MKKAARNAVALAKLKKNEKCLVITDKPTQEVGEAIYEAVKEKCETAMMIIKPTGEHSREPPKDVAEAMSQVDVVFAPTKYSLTHTDARRNALKKGTRVATLPGITKEIFMRGLSADNNEIKKNRMKIKKKLKNTKLIHIVGKNTACWIKYNPKAVKKMEKEREVQNGLPSNLPWGEVCFAPKDAGGYMTVYHSKSAKKGTRIEFDKRKVTDVIGDAKLKKKLWSIKNARNIAELGIGANPKTKLTGNTLEDEKVLGTCHIAIGDSKSLGGDVSAGIHQDYVIDKPSIWFDDKRIMYKGKLL